jgi:hypothetical protein
MLLMLPGELEAGFQQALKLAVLRGGDQRRCERSIDGLMIGELTVNSFLWRAVTSIGRGRGKMSTGRCQSRIPRRTIPKRRLNMSVLRAD